MSLNAFRLSRLYAEGWNVANKLTAEESSDFDAQKMAALNPYSEDPERAKWSEGFSAFMKKSIAS
jgi:hypothetical protein